MSSVVTRASKRKFTGDTLGNAKRAKPRVNESVCKERLARRAGKAARKSAAVRRGDLDAPRDIATEFHFNKSRKVERELWMFMFDRHSTDTLAEFNIFAAMMEGSDKFAKFVSLNCGIGEVLRGIVRVPISEESAARRAHRAYLRSLPDCKNAAQRLTLTLTIFSTLRKCFTPYEQKRIMTCVMYETPRLLRDSPQRILHTVERIIPDRVQTAIAHLQQEETHVFQTRKDLMATLCFLVDHKMGVPVIAETRKTQIKVMATIGNIKKRSLTLVNPSPPEMQEAPDIATCPWAHRAAQSQLKTIRDQFPMKINLYAASVDFNLRKRAIGQNFRNWSHSDVTAYINRDCFPLGFPFSNNFYNMYVMLPHFGTVARLRDETEHVLGSDVVALVVSYL